MPYLLQRIDQKGGYVANMTLSRGSYTRNILRAKQYATAEQAKADSCIENETVIYLDILLRRE